MSSNLLKKEYSEVSYVSGPLLFLQNAPDLSYNAIVRIVDGNGRQRGGQVIEVSKEYTVLQVFEETSGIDLSSTTVSLVENVARLGVARDMIGRRFDGAGAPIDGLPPVVADKRLPIGGAPINPVARRKPEEFIQTGISTIDSLISLVRGQKLPIFSGGGLPHDRIAVEIAGNARLRGAEAGDFAIVFAGIGVPYTTAEYFRRSLEQSGALERSALFLNLASDSSTQRLLTPRFALTAAEYLAFELGKHVLVILTDLTNYCEALREVAGARGEVPGRKGYPGYMYSDLATLYERAGCLHAEGGSKPGTLTQLPILTMPSDDIGHPIPDLSGYITEGQIVLSRELDRAGVYPPVNVLPSLSRLMKDGTGKGRTHADHPALASQLYAAYARASQARLLASVVGDDGLAEIDRRYLAFGRDFEGRLVSQTGARTLEESMDVGWELLRALPAAELTRLSDAQIAEHLPASAAAAQANVASA